MPAGTVNSRLGLYPSVVFLIDAHHHISVYYTYTDIAMETANAEVMGYACSTV